jgi:hypothetical protein
MTSSLDHTNIEEPSISQQSVADFRISVHGDTPVVISATALCESMRNSYPLNSLHTVLQTHLHAGLPSNWDVGRWGEAFVYQYLLQRYPDRTIIWENEHEESKAFYDIRMVGSHLRNLSFL